MFHKLTSCIYILIFRKYALLYIIIKRTKKSSFDYCKSYIIFQKSLQNIISNDSYSLKRELKNRYSP